MAELQEARSNRENEAIVSEEWSISSDDILQVEDWLETDNQEALQKVVDDYHYSAQADLIQHLHNPEQRVKLAQFLTSYNQYDFWSELDESVRSELAERIETKDLATVVSELDNDDAVAVLENLDSEEEREAIIQELDAEDRHAVRESFSWPEDSAGRMMAQDFIAFPSYMQVGDAIDWFRNESEKEEVTLPEKFFNIYLLDPLYKPIGQVALSKLLQTRRNVELKEIAEEQLPTIEADMDQEDVAFLFKQKDLVSAPVVDKRGCMIGEITVDDVVDVIEEEHEEDFMALGGVMEEDLYERIRPTAKARIRWLLLNMVTAVFAAGVISLFSETIETVVVLAALMPIVASLGGNAGSQTLTVAVRALATRELASTNAWRFIRKEGAVGLINGIVLAIVGGMITLLWQHDISLALVIAAALIFNLMVASLAGAFIPLGLSRYGIDPAIASSVFLTAITDVIGFFVFLGFASIFLV
ncbi:MAG: magnesium transporter [Alphaproteobacteria bacterium]